ncbi:GNAT family N-acetyltransferase [Actinokineospora enzanensis]|uniref:GNAT family N-acetyltransferase n=1 Tax=Actinokineospora enzanensis TaxID=155975 RepID=UPI0003AAE47B
MEIIVDDLAGPAIAAFLAEHVAEMRSLTPLSSKHALDLAGLRLPGITFWSMMDGPAVVGCCALKELDAGHAEIKSMRTAPARKRQGIAATLLRHVIGAAVRDGYRRLSLETGSADFFAPARALYTKHGFGYCAPFGDYREDPHSVYMTREL